MEIGSIRHKALRTFFVEGKPKGLPADLIGRIRKMLAFIAAAAGVEELAILPNYGLHPLTGDRRGEWAMTVSRNWRMTFSLNAEGAIVDLDLEDYH